MPNVYILTWCKSLESLYGSLLVFQTLRVGFPTSPIYVFDNGSLPEACEAIREEALRCGAVFTQVKREVQHHVFLNEMINRQQDGAAVFVDPDICFWNNVESWRFNALFAGRRIPCHREDTTGGIVHARAHTSLLWIPDVRKLREAIFDVRRHKTLFGYDPFRPTMFRINGAWHHYDTGASLVAAFPDRVHFFSERELDCYDHLFFGSHLSWVTPKMPKDAFDLVQGTHSAVQRDYNTLRGTWRRQDKYFSSRQIQASSGVSVDVGGALTSIIIPCWNQLEMTRQCIASLKKHTRRPWELIVVDNGSTDGTDIYLAGVRDCSSVPVTVISNATNRGFPAAINQGLEVARGEYLVMLNNDVVVTDGWLEQLIGLVNAKRGFTAETAEHAEGRTEGTGFLPEGKFTTKDAKDAKGKELIASVGPESQTSDTSDGGIRADAIVAGLCEAGFGAGLPPRSQTSATKTDDRRLGIGLVGPMSNYAAPPQLVESVPYHDLAAMQEYAGRWRDEHRGKWFTVRKLSGFCLLMKRAVYENIGGLDERFGLGFFDDDDLSRRSRRAGFALAVAQDLFVHHFGSRTFRGNGIDAEKLLVDNAQRFAEKWGLKNPRGKPVTLRLWRTSAEMASDKSLERAGATGELTAPRTSGERPKVSLTMIVRDEERNLPRCLESVRGLFDEIVVVDTGSVDRTKEIAREFEAKVFDFVWIDDFAAARNEALAHATGDYAFWLDADDVVESAEREKLRMLLEGLVAPEGRSAADMAQQTIERSSLAVALAPSAAFEAPCTDEANGLPLTRPSGTLSPMGRGETGSHFLAQPGASARSSPSPHAGEGWGERPVNPQTGPRLLANPVATAQASPSPQRGEGRGEGAVHPETKADEGCRNTLGRPSSVQPRPLDRGLAAYVVRCACAPGPDGKRGGTVVDHVRLFPILPGVRWSYRVHEQILPSLRQAKIPVKWTDLVVTHTGYIDADGESRKLDRNIKILKQELEEKPNDPFVLFNLGMSAVERCEWTDAREFLERSLAGSAPADSIVRKIYALLARVHQSTGDLQEAVRTCDEGLKLDPEDAELWHRKAVALRHQRKPAEAERCWRRILELRRPDRFCSFDQGLYGHITRRNLAALAVERGDLAEAAHLYDEVLAECPGDHEVLAHLRRLQTRPADEPVSSR